MGWFKSAKKIFTGEIEHIKAAGPVARVDHLNKEDQRVSHAAWAAFSGGKRVAADALTTESAYIRPNNAAETPHVQSA
jgi:hypothetical protein